MPWWAWLGSGIVLVVIELLGADLAFYLAFVGASAMVVGILQAAGAELPAWGQWLAFATLSVVAMVLFRERLYKRLRGDLPGFDVVAPAGGLVRVGEAVPAGGSARIALRGTEWDARNIGATAIAAGAEARVVKVEGTVLQIIAETEPAPTDEADGPAAEHGPSA